MARAKQILTQKPTAPIENIIRKNPFHLERYREAFFKFHAYMQNQQMKPVAFHKELLGRQTFTWVGGGERKRFYVWEFPLYRVFVHNEKGIQIEVPVSADVHQVEQAWMDYMARMGYDHNVLGITGQHWKKLPEHVVREHIFKRVVRPKVPADQWNYILEWFRKYSPELSAAFTDSVLYAIDNVQLDEVMRRLEDHYISVVQYQHPQTRNTHPQNQAFFRMLWDHFLAANPGKA